MNKSSPQLTSSLWPVLLVVSGILAVLAFLAVVVVASGPEGFDFLIVAFSLFGLLIIALARRNARFLAQAGNAAEVRFGLSLWRAIGERSLWLFYVLVGLAFWLAAAVLIGIKLTH